MPKPFASLSLDLDNKWSYLKTHGDKGWETFPSYLPLVVPRILDFFYQRQQALTFFVVGRDAERPENKEPIRAIVDAGHEIGNHSYEHEPWLHLYSQDAIRRELDLAEDRLLNATGIMPRGFRGPGFSFSQPLLQEVAVGKFVYDGSTFPTFFGPLARSYYFLTSHLSRAERQERRKLFGGWSDGLRPLRPYCWKEIEPTLVEIPVTTFPVLRSPIHLSYILFLGQRLPRVALTYLAAALKTCKTLGVAPSLLLHPLDFLGREDDPDLAFFPGMNWSREPKLEFLGRVLDRYLREFQVGTMLEHAQRVTCLSPVEEAAVS